MRRELRMARKDHAAVHRPLYVSDQAVLVETGIGKLPAAASVAAVLACYPSVRGVLNVGIAGGTEPIGSACLAHAVQDRASGRRWYPDLPARRITPTIQHHTTVETVDAPDTQYRKDAVFDMEAAGVYTAAVPVLGSAGVQCLKVISDGPEHSLETIDKHVVSALIEGQLQAVVALHDYLAARSEPARDHNTEVLQTATHIETNIARHSETEGHRLRLMLSRHLTCIGRMPTAEELAPLDTPRALIDWLDTRINNSAVTYG